MDGAITAGRVGGLFGKKGELTLVLYDTFPREIRAGEPLFVTIDGHTVPLFLERFERRGVRGATAVFADIDTAGRATELIGLEFRVPGGRNAADAAAELYFEDLVGWEAEVGQGATGRITAFHDSEMNPLIEIELGGQSELIPAVEEFIVEVDEQRRRVTFALPEGLLGLNK